MSKKQKKRVTKLAMADKRASVGFAMENPMMEKVKERPFGGQGAAEAGNLRHVSGADPVDLGGVDIVKSKHQKYKERGEEQPQPQPPQPHVARAAGFNSLKKSGNSSNKAKVPPPPVVDDDYEDDDDDAPPLPPPPKEPEWDELWDENSNSKYYVSRITGNSVWDKPNEDNM
ncbi:hypothetical protein ScalyP_jg2858 [Parmales sp. scaly parma]|nr:hypothetical protein ScalyP_jg2858 [Parmales sp. scaly parma]